MIASLIQTHRLDFPLLSPVPVRLPRKKQQRKSVQQTVSSDINNFSILQLLVFAGIFIDLEQFILTFFTIMIIWQSNLKVNPSVLNGSLLVEILRY